MSEQITISLLVSLNTIRRSTALPECYVGFMCVCAIFVRGVKLGDRMFMTQKTYVESRSTWIEALKTATAREDSSACTAISCTSTGVISITTRPGNIHRRNARGVAQYADCVT